MKFEQVSQSNHETQEVVVLIRIDDAEPRPIWHTGKVRWRPEVIRGRWTRYRANGGAWSGWRWSGNAVGPQLKGDGSPSARGDHVDSIYSYGLESTEWGEAVLATQPGDEPGEPWGEARP